MEIRLRGEKQMANGPVALILVPSTLLPKQEDAEQTLTPNHP
jgi:hypothetical protein